MKVKELLETVPCKTRIRIADKWNVLGTIYDDLKDYISKSSGFMSRDVYCVYPEGSKLIIIVE